MFDKLVESTKQKPQGRNRFYLVTSLIYGVALSVVAVLTIIWFNPGLAEANTGIAVIFNPPPPPPPPPPTTVQIAAAPEPRWIPPVKPPETIADPTTVPPKPPIAPRQSTVIGAPDTAGLPGGIRDGIPGGVKPESDTEPPPPPTPVPTPKATPTPAPTPETPKMVTVPSSILQGKAIRKVQPPYPQIARQARAQGSVPVQITISEEGRVIDASVVGGHPLLRDAARQAALQWAFSPTVLNGKNVKVSGVISFNFILN